MMSGDIGKIHDYWFGELDETGLCAEDHNGLWFGYSAQTDQFCADQFGTLVDQATGGGLIDWPDNDRGLIALTLLLDQMTRNIYRGTPDAFSGDDRALALTQQTIAAGHHQRLPAIHQVFLYMPLEHCEDLEVQDECVTLFGELAAITGNAQIADFAGYAQAHRDVIAQFGRFPHRNAILERVSSASELTYLDKHGGF